MARVLRPLWRSPLALVNGRVVTPDGPATSIRVGSRVLDLDGPPKRGDCVIDLGGAFVLPGLVNAHDHLELNHYGRLKFRDRYHNATEWIDDMRPRLRDDPAIAAGRAHPLRDRLLIGALKNLLAGVTTVAHHNPVYREMGGSFPVRIVRRFGWAHSYALEHGPVGAHGEDGGEVRGRFRATSPDVPFIVHAAEGVDAAAAAEIDRLESEGCVRDNTVLVHGVAMSDARWRRVSARGARLVWCPASNHFLFGRTAPVGRWLAADRSSHRIALGTDSRVTGTRDLLEEMRCAARHADVSAADVLRMVTTAAADALRLDHGRLTAGAAADLVVVPHLADDPSRALLACTRRDLALVMIGGCPRVADRAFAAAFSARRVAGRRLVVDGEEKIADAALVRRLERATLREAGVEW
jgi:cytosine/adenosine deaminase-related metal-dependent hydrolase